MLRATALLIGVSTVAAGNDPCTAAQSACDQCVQLKGCGWCSTKIEFQDGSAGGNCAGPQYEKPFTCSGIYSTETCSAGYSCDTSSYQCKLAPGGQGMKKADCESGCKAPPPGVKGYKCDQATKKCVPDSSGSGSPSVQICQLNCFKLPPVFKCNTATKTCESVPPFTPNSTSNATCAQTCGKPTPKPTPKPPVPGPPPTPPPLAKVYLCNVTTFKCDIAKPYTPGSGALDRCQKACVKPAPAPTPGTGFYTCDQKTLKCVKGGKDGINQTACEAICKPAKDPCMPHYSCVTCLAASPECGWCSTNVTYESGQSGTQCAGVGPDIERFACNGQYSTDKCLNGFTCDTSNGKCVDAGPGKGVPISQCQTRCVAPTPKPTPKPTPRPTPKPTAPPKCSVKLDLLFVLDASKSIKADDWAIDKQAGADIASRFKFGCSVDPKVGGADAEMGIIEFATQTNVAQHLTCDKNAFDASLAGLKQPCPSGTSGCHGWTYTGDALEAASQEFKSHGRPGDAKVVILITDGVPCTPDAPQSGDQTCRSIVPDPVPEKTQATKATTWAATLKGEDVTIVSIAVGNFGKNGMQFIQGVSSSPSSSHVFNPSTWKELPQLIQTIINGICPPAPSPASW